MNYNKLENNDRKAYMRYQQTNYEHATIRASSNHIEKYNLIRPFKNQSRSTQAMSLKYLTPMGPSMWSRQTLGINVRERTHAAHKISGLTVNSKTTSLPKNPQSLKSATDITKD